jgi:hypothetical protein
VARPKLDAFKRTRIKALAGLLPKRSERRRCSMPLGSSLLTENEVYPYGHVSHARLKIAL